MIGSVRAAKKPLLAPKVEGTWFTRVDRQGADVALDKHTIRCTREGIAAIAAAPQPFTDGAHIKPMRGYHD
jgi:hypothetical protein